MATQTTATRILKPSHRLLPVLIAVAFLAESAPAALRITPEI